MVLKKLDFRIYVSKGDDFFYNRDKIVFIFVILNGVLG